MALKPTTCKEAIAIWEKNKGENAAEAKVIELQFQWPPIEKMDGALSTLVACEKLSLSSNMIDKIAGIAGMRNLKILSLGRNYIKSLAGIETVADSLEQLWISYNPIDKLKGIGSLKKLVVLYMANNLIKETVEFNRLQVWMYVCFSLCVPMATTAQGIPVMWESQWDYEFETFVERARNMVGIPKLGHLPKTNFSMEKKKMFWPLMKPVPIDRECPNLRDLVFIGNPIVDAQPDMDTWRTFASNRLQQINKLDGNPILRETD